MSLVRRSILTEAMAHILLHCLVFASLAHGDARPTEASDRASVYFTDSGHAQVMRNEPEWLHSRSARGHHHSFAGIAKIAAEEEPSPTVLSGALCNTSMVGIWRLSEDSARDREFQIVRKVDGNMYFQEVLPDVASGFRTGWLQQSRSHNAVPSCRFKTTLTDGAVVHLYLHRAEGFATLEVSQVGQQAFPILARHPTPSAYSPDSVAWLVAVLVLLSGPMAATVCSRSGHSSSAAVTSESSDVTGEVKDGHEDWMDVLRLTCIVFMVVRHAVQSLERLGQVPTVDLSFILHGLPLFVYVAGRGFGTAVVKKAASACGGGDASWKARFLDHLSFVKRRAMQLILPSIICTALVVIPTEYVGRKWRTCAKGPDAPLSWLQAYLFGGGGIRCEGLGWLGFMISLFIMQAMLRPWAMVLHGRIAAASRPLAGEDLGWMMFWVSAGIMVGSLGLNGDGPFGIAGFLRPDTALAFAPALADLLSVNYRLAWIKGKVEWQAAPASSMWLPALARRVVASVAMATWTRKAPYDDFLYGGSNNASGLWIELCLLTMFYQQGVVDGILRSAPGNAAPALGNLNLGRLQKPMAVAGRLLEKMKATRPLLTDWLRFLVAFNAWLLVSFAPVAISTDTLRGPGYRYPAYYWASAGSFVLRSWAVLGLALWWWGHHLPKAMIRLKMIAPLGFTLYLLHWFFIELVMSGIYQSPHEPQPGDTSWWFALLIALTVCLLAVSMCHMALKAAMGQGIKWKIKKDEFVITIQTGDEVST